ncbi:MAG: ABC transporter permease, partial [bacterium]
SARLSQGVTIRGIEKKERVITNINDYIIQGEYAALYDKQSIIIGSELVKKLRVGLKKKVVVMGQAMDKSIHSNGYRIKAIVRTNNPDIDRYSAILPLKEVQKMFLAKDHVSSFSIILNNEGDCSALKNDLGRTLGDDYEIYTWNELYPLLESMQSSLETYNIITFFIVFLVVAIGIFDIFLISILERIKEFGIMLAIGTKFSQLAQIIMLESLTIGAIGLAFGSLLGFLVLVVTHGTGINFGFFAAGMEFSGIAAVVHPQIAIMYFIWAAIAVFITSCAAVLWPIRMVYKLKPIQAIRFV